MANHPIVLNIRQVLKVIFINTILTLLLAKGKLRLTSLNY